MNNNELYHYGVLGMKWGVRRYQKKNGSLTPAGKKRRKMGDDNVHEDYRKAHDSKSVKSMSDTELRNRNNRLQMERQYRDLTRKTSKGEKFVKAFVTTAGTITAIEGAYKVYAKYGNKVIDGIGNIIVKDLSRGLAKGFR